MTERITEEWLRVRRACEECIDAFAEAYPDGLDYDPTDVAQAAQILAGPLARYMAWAIDQGLPPQRLTGGDRSTVSGGWYATVTGGPYSTVTGGHESTVTGGAGSTVTGGDESTVIGGAGSTVTGGIGATVSGGDCSILTIRHYDGVRWRRVTAYVGEDGIEPGVRYRLDRAGRFVRAEGVSDD